MYVQNFNVTTWEFSICKKISFFFLYKYPISTNLSCAMFIFRMSSILPAVREISCIKTNVEQKV